MDSLFIRLRHYAEIGDEERDALAAMPTRRAEYAAGDTIVAQGDDPIEAFIVNKGWAARYIALEDGRTQILNFMLPGDMFDFQVFVASSADHSISAITSLEILKIRRRDILAVFRSGTNAGAAFWWAALQEEAMLREQIVRNGRRSARERIAHLFLELHRRALIVGQGEGDEFSLPVSQALIADAVGLSFVHVNRVMRAFESEGLIERSRETLILRDRDALAEISGFSDAYLHLDADPRRLALERA